MNESSWIGGDSRRIGRGIGVRADGRDDLPGYGGLYDAPVGRDLAVRELKDAYPEGVMFRRNLPAWAFYVRHADGIRFENVNCVLTGTDAREKFVFDDADVQVK